MILVSKKTEFSKLDKPNSKYVKAVDEDEQIMKLDDYLDFFLKFKQSFILDKH